MTKVGQGMTGSGDSSSRFMGPYKALALFTIAAILIQIPPLVLPIGPMYWDVIVYYDAIGRIGAGQWPVLDFMIPSGPAEIWLAWFSDKLFPEAHPVLLTQLAWLPVTVPVMALILRELRGASSIAAWGLLLPWMLFTALPFNDIAYSTYAGTDAFGIYNRHGAHLLYLVAATVLFVRGRIIQTLLLSVLMLSLAFCKITAFAAAGPVLLLGLLAGRIRVRTAFATAVTCLLAAGILEIFTGIVSAYLRDIMLLAKDNSASLLPRFLTAISHRFDILGAGAILCALLVYRDFRQSEGEGFQPRAQSRVQAFFDSDWLWVGVTLFSGLVFETQNTGSQSYLLVWPAVLLVLLREHRRPAASPLLGRLIMVAIVFAVVPSVSRTLHKAVRTAALAPRYVQLEAPALGPLGRVSIKGVLAEQAERMRSIYVSRRPTMEAIAQTEALPSFMLFSEPDYQYLLLQEAGRAAAAIQKLEDETGKRFETVFNVDFINPFTYALGRAGPKHVAIGADPSRSVPEPDARTLQAVADTDLVLLPKCPFHFNRLKLAEIYAPALRDKEEIVLTPCYDALLKKGWRD